MRSIAIAALALSLSSVSIRAAEPTVAGWYLAGSKPADYSVSTESQAHSGKQCARLGSVAPRPTGFGTLMQMFDASQYRGKKLRVTGYVRTLDVVDWAGLWMRVDGVAGQVLAFDNMVKRPIKGTTEWVQYSIVLDVPATALAVGFGVLLNGAGSVLVDDFAFDTVGPEVATTGTPGLPSSPRNLDFEQ
jgi:hypothetical protein